MYKNSQGSLRDTSRVGNLTIDTSLLTDENTLRVDLDDPFLTSENLTLYLTGSVGSRKVKAAPLGSLAPTLSPPLGEIEGIIITRESNTALRFNGIRGRNKAIVEFPSSSREWATVPEGYTKNLSPFAPGSDNGGLIPGNVATGASNIFVWLVKTTEGEVNICYTNDESGGTLTSYQPTWAKRCLGVFKLSGGNFRDFYMNVDRWVKAGDALPINYNVSADYTLEGCPTAGMLKTLGVYSTGLPANGGTIAYNIGSPLSPPPSPVVQAPAYTPYNADLGASYSQDSSYWIQIGAQSLVMPIYTNNGTITIVKSGSAHLSPSYYPAMKLKMYKYIGG